MLKQSLKAEGKELFIERIFNAPRELVFQAFSDAEHLKQWWGRADGPSRFAMSTSARAASGIIA
ncbi:hypothetical protein CM49_01193 [Paenibacillus sp. P1XP2]|nr:hypothetical protein CM49_01193 [Paenibacillus sp. P1XP2]